MLSFSACEKNLFLHSAPATSNTDFTPISASQVVFTIQGPTTSSSFEVGRFNLTIVDDQVSEPTEQVTLQLFESLKFPDSLPVVVSSEEAVVTILDDDR